MTRDEIISMARKAGFPFNKYGALKGDYDGEIDADEMFEHFAALVAAAEREACAKVCEQRKIITPEWQHDQFYNQCATHCAAAIRAMSEKGTA